MSYVAYSQVAIKFPQVGGIYILFPDYSKVYEFVHNFRPIYHQKDSASDVHLFLGLLSYWVVNAIRYRLKTKGETCFWTEIVRRMSTQKAVTEGVSKLPDS